MNREEVKQGPESRERKYWRKNVNLQPYSINDFVFRDEKSLVLDPLKLYPISWKNKKALQDKEQ